MYIFIASSKSLCKSWLGGRHWPKIGKPHKINFILFQSISWSNYILVFDLYKCGGLKTNQNYKTGISQITKNWRLPPKHFLPHWLTKDFNVLLYNVPWPTICWWFSFFTVSSIASLLKALVEEFRIRTFSVSILKPGPTDIHNDIQHTFDLCSVPQILWMTMKTRMSSSLCHIRTRLKLGSLLCW